MALSQVLSAQIFNPVIWEFTSKKIDDSTYEIHVKATVEHQWHIYSQYTEEGGPLPTTLTFEGNPNVKLKGKAREVGNLIEKYEEVFMVETRYYADSVDFVQVVTTKTKLPLKLSGSVTFMACTDEQCLTPQEEEFEVTLN